MGMFDDIKIDTDCPNCKEGITLNLQTKAGQKTLHTYRLGEKFHFNKETLQREKKSLEHHSKPKYLIWLAK